MLLRECLKHECLASLFLSSKLVHVSNIQELFGPNASISDSEMLAPNSDNFTLLDLLFEFAKAPNYDIASDAFATLKDILTRHKQLVSVFLEENYEQVNVAIDKH